VRSDEQTENPVPPSESAEPAGPTVDEAWATEDSEQSQQSEPRTEIVIPRPARLLRRGLPQVVEASMVPAVLFYTVHRMAGVSWALLCCLTWNYAAILRRAVTGRRLPTILIAGATLVSLRTITGLVTGSVFLYFLQPVLGAACLSVAFATSVACGRPILVRIVQDFCPIPPEVLASPPVRSILTRLTLAWAGVHLLNGMLTAVLLVSTPLGVFLAVRIIGVYLVTGLGVVVSLLWGRRAGAACGIDLRLEPRPDGDAIALRPAA
jgi:hypothetical protein